MFCPQSWQQTRPCITQTLRHTASVPCAPSRPAPSCCALHRRCALATPWLVLMRFPAVFALCRAQTWSLTWFRRGLSRLPRQLLLPHHPSRRGLPARSWGHPHRHTQMATRTPFPVLTASVPAWPLRTDCSTKRQFGWWVTQCGGQRYTIPVVAAAIWLGSERWTHPLRMSLGSAFTFAGEAPGAVPNFGS